MSFATDLYRRSQTRRRLAFAYLEWAKSDLKAGKLDRCAENANHFHSLMHGARMDLYSLRVWGFYAPKPLVRYLEAAE